MCRQLLEPSSFLHPLLCRLRRDLRATLRYEPAIQRPAMLEREPWEDEHLKSLVYRWGPVAACLGIIYVGSEQPAVRRAPAKIEYAVAKISHVLEFAALG